jgi:uncharacterized protein (TIGR03435 family)
MMIQTLLGERFKVTTHRENREMNVYVMTVGRGGPKLQPAQEGTCDPSAPLTPPGQRAPGQKPTCISGFNVNLQYHFNVFMDAITVGQFAEILSGALERPIIDRTGITGMFDFHFESSVEDTLYREMLQRFQPADNPPTVFDAIQQRLGLKLDPGKALVEALIIDHAEKPTEN